MANFPLLHDRWALSSGTMWNYLKLFKNHKVTCRGSLNTFTSTHIFRDRLIVQMNWKIVNNFKYMPNASMDFISNLRETGDIELISYSIKSLSKTSGIYDERTYSLFMNLLKVEETVKPLTNEEYFSKEYDCSPSSINEQEFREFLHAVNCKQKFWDYLEKKRKNTE